MAVADQRLRDRFLPAEVGTLLPNMSGKVCPLRVDLGDGLVFDALAAGPDDGEVVLLLHGFPQSAAIWLAQLEALAAAGYRAIAPDQRGYSADARPEGVEH